MPIVRLLAWASELKRGQSDAYAAGAGLRIVADAFSVPEVTSDSCLSVQQAAKAVMALTRPSVIGAVIIPGDAPVSTQLADGPCVSCCVCQALACRAPLRSRSGL